MKRSLIAIAAGALCGAACAADPAYTVRPTELKAKPFTDAATLASLAEAAKVDVLQRQASWMQVKADKHTGWVKMLNLRFDQPVKGSSINSDLNVMFKVATTGSGGSTATTGVKGVSEEDLKNLHPNPAMLAQVNEMTVTPQDLQAFSKSGKLNAQKIDYVAAPAASGAKK